MKKICKSIKEENKNIVNFKDHEMGYAREVEKQEKNVTNKTFSLAKHLLQWWNSFI